jgi:hypothetical protein
MKLQECDAKNSFEFCLPYGKKICEEAEAWSVPVQVAFC